MSLSAYKGRCPHCGFDHDTLVIPAPQPDGEPVAWLSIDCIRERYLCFSKPMDNDAAFPLFTYPPDAQARIVELEKQRDELVKALRLLTVT